MTKNTAAKAMPLMVATDLVNKLTTATDSKTRKTENRPTGISIFPMRMFGGTFQPRSPWYFHRKTSIARLLKVKDQITPKAYASPSMMTLPRVTIIVNRSEEHTSELQSPMYLV